MRGRVVFMNFLDAVKSTPIVGEASSLRPTVDVAAIVRSNMTNNPIEEDLWLAIPLNAIVVNFREHQAADLS
jgi:hypothetical protein